MLLTIGLGIGIAPAWAHVHVDAQDAVRGKDAVLTSEVPNESDTGALTTALSVVLPDVASTSTEVMPVWTAKLDRDIKEGTVRSVTWTATPEVGIAADQFAQFRVEVTLPDTDTAVFPVTETYSDGTVVRWDQPPLTGGAEPEHPAPTLTLTAGSPEPSVAPTDDTPRWLAGGALIVAALGVGIALLGSRRS